VITGLAAFYRHEPNMIRAIRSSAVVTSIARLLSTLFDMACYLVGNICRLFCNVLHHVQSLIIRHCRVVPGQKPLGVAEQMFANRQAVPYFGYMRSLL
jgi:hypothetical protein